MSLPDFLRKINIKGVRWDGQWEKLAHNKNSKLMKDEIALVATEDDLRKANQHLDMIDKLKADPEALRQYLTSLETKQSP